MKNPVIIGMRGNDPLMPFTHEDGDAEAFYQAAFHKVSGTFHPAADEGVRYFEPAKTVLFGKAPVDDIRYPLSMDIKKIKRRLSFTPRFSTGETLRSFIDAQPQGA
jgi:nucleoside-diphosphate-sugar epimerase